MEPQPPANFTPADPPRIKPAWLWTTLLAPLAIVSLLLLFAIALDDFNITVAAFISGATAIVVFWIAFGIIISKRIKGLHLILLTLAYPIAQIVVCLTVFFFGCLNTLDLGYGGKRPPSSYTPTPAPSAPATPPKPATP